MHTYIHAWIHTYIHSYIHIFIHTYIHSFIHSYIHIFIHTYIHICIVIYLSYIKRQNSKSDLAISIEKDETVGSNTCSSNNLSTKRQSLTQKDILTLMKPSLNDNNHNNKEVKSNNDEIDVFESVEEDLEVNDDDQPVDVYAKVINETINDEVENYNYLKFT